MTLKEQFERAGDRFFRWRSYLPLLMAGLFMAALLDKPSSWENSPGARWWALSCLGVSLVGLGIRFFTVGFAPRGTSGRNTREQVADSLNVTGMYSILRNPIYLGNAVIWMGLSLFIKSWWLTIIIVLFFTVFYERIIFAEEHFLQEKFGEAFFNWARQTPAILPNFKNWQPPVLPFSWKSALAREYGTFYAIIVSFTLVKFMGDWFSTKKVTIDGMWAIIFGVGTLIYVTVRILKKKTKVLSTVDR
jgi:protein-S-isoprenylcysteine O-methyltransferase Ste14